MFLLGLKEENKLIISLEGIVEATRSSQNKR